MAGACAIWRAGGFIATSSDILTNMYIALCEIEDLLHE